MPWHRAASLHPFAAGPRRSVPTQRLACWPWWVGLLEVDVSGSWDFQKLPFLTSGYYRHTWASISRSDQADGNVVVRRRQAIKKASHHNKLFAVLLAGTHHGTVSGRGGVPARHTPDDHGPGLFLQVSDGDRSGGSFMLGGRGTRSVEREGVEGIEGPLAGGRSHGGPHRVADDVAVESQQGRAAFSSPINPMNALQPAALGRTKHGRVETCWACG
jgi:hypothetical protein